MDKQVIPAILTDSIQHLEELADRVEGFVDYVQIDYVDGYFAPEITCCEARVIKEVEFVPNLEVHLMVEEPIKQVKGWYQAGAERIVGHIEEMEDQLEFVERVCKLGVEVGLALNLETSLDDLDVSIVPSLDVILLMAHPVGVQGVKFQPQVLAKIQGLRKRFPNLNIEVDGGINPETIVQADQAGANYFAVGSDIFNSKDPFQEYQKLVDLVKE